MPPPPYLGRARLGNRVNAFRVGHFDVTVQLTVAGVARHATILKDSLAIRDVRGGAPSTAEFTTASNPGWTPTRGQAVVIGLGSISNRVFAGQVEAVEQFYESIAANVRYRVTCTDATRLLNRYKVWQRYTNSDASTIVLALMASHTGGFDTSKVQRGLGTIAAIEFAGVDVTDVLDAVAAKVGASWFVDYQATPRLHFGTTSTEIAPQTIDASHPSVRDIRYRRLLRQVRTRIFALGLRVRVPAFIPSGSTALAIENIDQLPSSGTLVIGQSTVVTYSGLSQTATPTGVANAPSASTAALDSGVAGGVLGAVTYRISCVTPDGETVPGAASNSVTGTALAAPASALTAAEAHSASAVSVSGITRSSDVATVTTGSAHGFAVGMSVTIAGANQTQYNGTFTIATVPSSTTFTYTVAGAPATPATGTITAQSATAGRLIGTFKYRYTFVDARGETVASAEATATATAVAAPSALTAAEGHSASTVSVSGITRSSDTATVTTSSAHGFSVGMQVTIAGATQSQYNGTFTIRTVASTTVFTYEVTGAPTTPATGTITAQPRSSGPLIGAYTYVVTYLTRAGETAPSSVASVTASAASAPANAGTLTASTTTDGGVAAGTYLYQASYVTASGETSLSNAVSSNSATISAVTAPASAPSLSATTGGSLTPSTTYYYIVTYYTARGETTGSTVQSVALSSSQNAVSLTSIPTSADGRVVGRRIYRSAVSNGGPFYLVGSIGDNSTTTFTDNAADAGLATLSPTANTTGGQVAITSIPTSSDARVIGRKMWRTKAGGSIYYLLTTIQDNTTTSFTDAVNDSDLTETAPSEGFNHGASIRLTGIPTSSDPRVVGRRIYRTEAGGAGHKLVATLGDNTTTTLTDSTRDAELGASAPSEGSGHGAAVKLTGIAVSGDARVVSRRIYRTSVGGGSDFRLVTTIGDNLTTTWTDTRLDSDLGEAQRSSDVVLGHRVSLSGVPLGPSGTTARKVWRTEGGGSVYRFCGSIGDNVTATFQDSKADRELGEPLAIGGYLTGVTLTVDVDAGASARLRVMREDTAAQTAIAALEGGTGIWEHLIDAGDQATEADCITAADAELADFDAGEDTFGCTSRDPNMRSSTSQVVNLGAPHSISGTFPIQEVSWSGFEQIYHTVNGSRIPGHPLVVASASRTRLTLDDLLRMVAQR